MALPAERVDHPQGSKSGAAGASPHSRGISARLPWSAIIDYSLPTLGVGYMFFLINIFLMKFSTDVLLIAPAAMGMIFGASRLWDAVSDPMAGFLSDRTQSRFGRRRPWLLASSVPIALFFLMIWSPPSALIGPGLVAWMAIAVFGFFTATTILIIPHASLGAELTSNYHDRTRVFAVRQVGWNLGAFAALAAMFMLIGAATPRRTAAWLAVAAATMTAALIVYTTTRVRERSEFWGRGGRSPYSAFRDVWRNPHARLLLLVFLIESVGGATIGILTPYVAEYVVKTAELTTVYIALYMVFATISVPIWLPLSRRFGKKGLWLVSMILTGLGFGGMFFLRPGDVWLISTLAIVLGVAAGCGNIVAPSIQADVIDFDEYQTGERKEGSYFAAWNFVLKSATGITLMLTGFVLQFSGFVPNVEQTERAKLALLVLYAIFPFFCYLIGALIFSRFRLNEREYAEIRRTLDGR
jgi:GPH family glycoside/pentoside/hexuronide:cation symporter